MLDNYSALISTWKQSEETRDPELKIRLGGVAHQMTKFSFIFGVALGELILRHSDNLSRTLQRGDISASEGQAAPEITLRTLLSHITADNSASFWKHVKDMATVLDILEPSMPRKRKIPKRLKTGTSEDESPATVDQHYQKFTWKHSI